MTKIYLKDIVDQNGFDLMAIAMKSGIPYEDIKEWYDTGSFDGDKVGVNHLTALSFALDVPVPKIIDLPNG